MPLKGQPVYILGYARTPIGSFLGALSTIPAPRLGSITIKAALERSGIDPSDVQECIMGNVLQAGVGQAPARQAAIFAGLPKSVECLTVNKVCASGLVAAMVGSRVIAMEDAQVIVAGGMESMSLAPYLLPRARTGFRMGNAEVVDAMIHDGLWDVYNNIHMGNCAEYCARKLELSREEQDAYAAESYRRALRAMDEGLFKREIVPVEVPQRKGDPVIVAEDEEPRRVNFEKMPKLKPVFDPEGTITAANASKLNDGAAAVVLAGEQWVQRHQVRPIARIVDFCAAAREPIEFPLAPVNAIQKLLQRNGLQPSEVDLYEINEAFASVALGAIKELGLDHKNVNVHGGAVALGHPIGASGARLLCTLLNALDMYGKRWGVVSLCNGGGEAVAMLVERMD